MHHVHRCRVVRAAGVEGLIDVGATPQCHSQMPSAGASRVGQATWRGSKMAARHTAAAAAG